MLVVRGLMNNNNEVRQLVYIIVMQRGLNVGSEGVNEYK